MLSQTRYHARITKDDLPRFKKLFKKYGGITFHHPNITNHDCMIISIHKTVGYKYHIYREEICIGFEEPDLHDIDFIYDRLEAGLLWSKI